MGAKGVRSGCQRTARQARFEQRCEADGRYGALVVSQRDGDGAVGITAAMHQRRSRPGWGLPQLESSVAHGRRNALAAGRRRRGAEQRTVREQNDTADRERRGSAGSRGSHNTISAGDRGLMVKL